MIFEASSSNRFCLGSENPTMLHYKKLDVYQCAIEFLALATEIMEKLPRGNSRLVGQFDSASMSIALNIAEGVGKTTSPDQTKFFAIARGSAMECGALLDVCRIRKLTSPAVTEHGEALVTRLVQMLSKLCRT
jgi:four helix bundle protein